jgi:hypothetical protein
VIGETEGRTAWVTKVAPSGPQAPILALGCTAGAANCAAVSPLVFASSPIALEYHPYSYLLGATSGAFAGPSAGGDDVLLIKAKLGYRENMGAQAEVGVVEWVRQSGTAADDTATAAVVSDQGDLYVAGRTGLTKVSAAGDVVWVKELLAGVGSLAVDSNGNVLFTSGNQRPAVKPWFGKFAPDGRLLWRKSADAAGSQVVVDQTNAVFLVNTNLAKYTPGGTLLWRRPIGGRLSIGDDGILSVVQGATVTTVAGDTGRILRQRTVTPPAPFVFRGLDLGPAGDFVAYACAVDDHTTLHYWLAKYRVDGALEWDVSWTTYMWEEPITALRFEPESRSVYLFGLMQTEYRGPFARAWRFEIVP